MNIREISDIFKDTADNITAIKSYNFGWASDRVRQGNTEDFQELNEFPRVFFSVPTITASDQTRKQDTYQVTLFFDDLLGYDNEGDEDPTLQIDKWANLQQYANYFVQRLNKIKQSILPNYLFIPEAPSITFDSFTGIQRMITVQLSFNLVVPTNCDPGIITLVQCIANIVTSSNLTASLTTVLKFAASLEGRATLTADINFVQKVASSLNANASLVSDINFVQKVQASLLTSASVTGNISIPKLVQASLTGTGTTAADLTVNAPSAGLLLDLYPNAAAAYSLRKLRTAYTGSAIRVRRSSDNTEQDIGFVADQLDTVSLLSFCGAGNGFVTTWYDQSNGNNNLTQTIQANQPQIVNSGIVITDIGNKPTLRFSGNQYIFKNWIFTLSQPYTNISVNRFINFTINNFPYIMRNELDNDTNLTIMGHVSGVGLRIFNGSSLGHSQPIVFNKNYLWFTIANGSSSLLSINNITVNGNAGTRTLTNGVVLGSYSATLGQLNGFISEQIIYNGSKILDQSPIQTNINTNYGIY